jgi:sporulation protein YlmC with PRC-barrel domain
LAEQDIWLRWEAAQEAHGMTTATVSSEGTVTRSDKASGLLGMEVRRPNGERLGRIKDLVIDWRTDHVAYTVISTGSSDKLLAVPLAALAPTANHKYLILGAEKSKMQDVHVFDSSNWPRIGPASGAEPSSPQVPSHSAS